VQQGSLSSVLQALGLLVERTAPRLSFSERRLELPQQASVTLLCAVGQGRSFARHGILVLEMRLPDGERPRSLEAGRRHCQLAPSNVELRNHGLPRALLVAEMQVEIGEDSEHATVPQWAPGHARRAGAAFFF
jgi:hypothetical protein